MCDNHIYDQHSNILYVFTWSSWGKAVKLYVTVELSFDVFVDWSGSSECGTEKMINSWCFKKSGVGWRKSLLQDFVHFQGSNSCCPLWNIRGQLAWTWRAWSGLPSGLKSLQMIPLKDPRTSARAITSSHRITYLVNLLELKEDLEG